MSKKSIYIVENEIRPGDYVFFYSGEVLTVTKYDKDRHRITFEDGSVRDLYVIYDNYVSDIRHPAEKVTKTKSDKKCSSKSKTTKAKPAKRESKTFSLYALASGKPGKKFTIKAFLQITKNAKKKPGGANTEKTIKLDDGYVYEADSQQEISTLKKLISHDAFKRLRGQCINIPYRYGGKTHNYYPDFIILTQTNKIIIMEVKEIAQMNTKQNIKKYDALKRYCEKNGYLYIMCDKTFKPYEKLSKFTASSRVETAIDDALDEKGCFDYSDFKELIKGKDHKKIKGIRNSIGIYIKSHKKVKMIGDLTFNSSDFRIIRIKKKK